MNKCNVCGKPIENIEQHVCESCRAYGECVKKSGHTPAPKECICDEMGWVEDCPRHSGAQPSRGAPTPVREGAAFTAKEFDAELWTERDPQNKLAFAEAFSAHQNAALQQELNEYGDMDEDMARVKRKLEYAQRELESLRKERDALREKLKGVL